MTALAPIRWPMHRLLPPQSTGLERAVLDASPRWDAYADLGSNSAHDRPDVFKPWWAAEWNLAQFTDYFEDLDQLFDHGLPWLRERGTAASVQRALGWLGYVAPLLEEDGPYVHIDLGRIATADEIARIRHVVNASLPAHVRFYRVFHAWDLRPIRLDDGPALDHGLLDNDSGVWVDPSAPDDVKASFGTRRAWSLPDSDQPACMVGDRLYATVLHDDISWRLDAWRLDSEIWLDASGGVQTIAGAALTDGADLQPEAALTELRGGAAAEAAEGPALAATDLDIAHLASSGSRGWHGAWAGSWRELIPARHTQSDSFED